MVRSYSGARPVAALATVVLVASADAATCVNKYVYRQQGSKIQITLLTGKLTFQEAKELAKAIAEKKSAALEWVDGSGKSLAKQMGELQVLRPMPVGCDTKTSGSVLQVTFLHGAAPSGKLAIKLPSETVIFDEQKQ